MMGVLLNGDVSLFMVVDDGDPIYIEHATRFDATWQGDPLVGCHAEAVVCAVLGGGGKELARVGNGDTLILVANKCGRRSFYDAEHELLRLERVGVYYKDADQLVASRPEDVFEPEVHLYCDGTLRMRS